MRQLVEDKLSVVAPEPPQTSIITILKTNDDTRKHRAPITKSPTRGRVFMKEHSTFMCEYFEKNELATSKTATEELKKAFAGMKDFSRSGLHGHLKKKCCLVIKTTTTEQPKILNIDKVCDFSNEHVFVGAVDYLMYIRRSFGWGRQGEPVDVVHSGIFVPTIAAFSARVVINIAIVTPSAIIQQKRNVGTGKGNIVASIRRKLLMYHAFLETAMVTISENGFKGRTFAVNDAEVFVEVFGAAKIKDLLAVETLRCCLFLLLVRRLFGGNSKFVSVVKIWRRKANLYSE